jgi:hypothetical protein
VLTTLHGRTPPATCQRREVLAAVAVQGGPSAEASPHPTDLLKSLGPGPILEGLLANLEEDSAAALVLGAHDPHAPLVVFAGAAAAKVEREFFYLFTRLRVEGDLPYRHPAVVAGMGTVLVLVLGRWVRVGCARLLCGHEVAPSWSGSGRQPPRRAVFMPLHPEV